MQTKEELIFKDLLAVFVLGIIIFYWNNELKNFWRFAVRNRIAYESKSFQFKAFVICFSLFGKGWEVNLSQLFQKQQFQNVFLPNH